MKTKRKASGFFIVEILIVLAIIAILVTALLPNLSLYTNRAKFADVLSGADALKPSIELCILTTGALTNCDNGSNGIPAAMATSTTDGNLGATAVADGVITATASTANGLTALTYILTPTITGNNTVNWTSPNTTGGGTCHAAGLC